MPKKIWLGIEEGSQISKVLERLVQNPSINSKELVSLWTQTARGGGETQISGSRAAFLADLLGDAFGDHRVPKKGLHHYPTARESLRMDAPAREAVQVVEQRKVEVVLAPEVPKPAPKLDSDSIVNINDVTKPEDEEFVFPEPPQQPKRLDHFIKPEWYQEFCDALSDGLHVSLAGPPGVGKSTVPEQRAVELNQTIITVNGHGGLRYRDVAGHTQVVGGRTRFLVAEYATAAIKGWWVVINEINAADESAILFMNGQLAPPYSINLNGKSFPVHPNFRVVCNYNPGYTGTKPINAALKDRFDCFKVPFPDHNILREMLIAHGMSRSEPNAGKLMDFAEELVDLKKRGVTRYEISPRRLYSAVRHLNRGKTLAEAIEFAVLNSVDSETDLTQLRRALQSAGVVPKED